MVDRAEQEVANEVEAPEKRTIPQVSIGDP
jgi:hypothetical protein